jgi:diadenosine tetraphosphate (Ap4A) HIT family hydrolase
VAGAERPCGICALIERASSGRLDDLVAELPHSWVILGDAQFYRGYCVLLAKQHLTELHNMERVAAHALYEELLALGEAIERVTNPSKLNYECLGNQEPHVHWHVFPRSHSDSRRLEPVWLRPEAERKIRLGEGERRELLRALRAELSGLVAGVRIP